MALTVHAAIASRQDPTPASRGSFAENLAPSLDSLAVVFDSLMDAASYARADSVAEQGLRRCVADQPLDSALASRWYGNRGRALAARGSFAEADSAWRSAIGLARALGPSGREDLLAALRGSCLVQCSLRNVAAAESLALEAFSLGLALYDRADVNRARDYALLGDVLVRSDRSHQAAAVLDSALALFAPDTTQGLAPIPGLMRILCDVLTLRALAARNLGEYPAAVRFYERSLAWKRAWLAPEDPSVAASLSGLAGCYRILGDLARAERLSRDALEMRIRVLGPGHPAVATLWNNLAVVLINRGDYAGAAEASRRALLIWRSALGDEDPQAATAMLNLSGPLLAQGDEREAIRLIREAIRILDLRAGPRHSSTALAVQTLGDAQQQCGDPVEAERSFRRALDVLEKGGGGSPTDIASLHYRIGRCLKGQHRLEDARREFDQAVRLAERNLGRDNWRLPLYRIELADLLMLSGSADQAQTMYKSSLAALEDRLGPEHHLMGTALCGLAASALELGRVEDAVGAADRAVTALRTSVGTDNQLMVAALTLAAGSRLAAGRRADAVRTALDAAWIASAIQADVAYVSSDREALAFGALPRRATSVLLGTANEAGAVPESVLAQVFVAVAQSHGQIYSTLAARQRALASPAGRTGAQGRFERRRAAAQRYANLVARGPRPDQPGYRAELAAAREEKEDAERALASTAGVEDPPREVLAHATAGVLRTLHGALEPGTLLVHYVRFAELGTGPGLWRRCVVASSIPPEAHPADRYGVFLLRRAASGGGADLRYVDLGYASAIDEAVDRWSGAVRSVRNPLRPSPREESDYRGAARDLYEAVWAPVAGSIDPGDSLRAPPLVLIVPEAELLRVDFGTLLAPDGALVIEACRPHILATAMDAARFAGGGAPVERRGAGGALVVSDPKGTPQHAPCSAGAWRDVPLPGAAAEADRVSALVGKRSGAGVVVLAGTQATESACKNGIAGRRILHFATHGFYCDEDERTTPLDAAAGGAEGPLLRSGLVLGSDRGVRGQGDDGYLTAQEIVVEDLQGTEWVVLSACDTGRGGLVVGEGLYGLRRAFELAGAGAVLSALWPLPDALGPRLMESLYNARLSGATTVDALRASLIEGLGAARRRGRIHPILWGGIVAEGDWK